MTDELVEVPDVEPRTSVRSSLGDAFAEVFDAAYLRQFAEEAKGLTTAMWGVGICPACGNQKRVLCDMPDIGGKLKIFISLLEQAEGRPGTATGEPAGVTIVVNRIWPGGEDGTNGDASGDLQAAAHPAGLPLVQG
jgi:hypothetical protein